MSSTIMQEIRSIAAPAIWRAYVHKAEMSYKTRNGTIACGVTSELDLSDAYSRPEFIAEHEGRSAFLFGMITSWQPYLMSPEMRADRMLFLLMHDAGELVGGDRLDDGSSEHSNEDLSQLEKEAMLEMLFCFPSWEHRRMTSIYDKFEEYRDSEVFIKAIDKVEAVLWQLFLHMHGHTGYVTNKKCPSGRDLRFGEILGTYRAIDVWCLHYRVALKDVKYRSVQLVDDVLKAAFMAVFGELPYCMTIDVTDISLDSPEDEAVSSVVEFPENEVAQANVG